MFADLLNSLTTVAAASPLSIGGGSLVCACGAMYLVTRLPEFLLMTATAAVYASVAMLPMHY
jgi:hypothetical protein